MTLNVLLLSIFNYFQLLSTAFNFYLLKTFNYFKFFFNYFQFVMTFNHFHFHWLDCLFQMQYIQHRNMI